MGLGLGFRRRSGCVTELSNSLRSAFAAYLNNPSGCVTSIDREGLNLGWEPRGDWDSGVVKSICDELRLWHVVDPFVNKTTTSNRSYFRLHGRNGWRYQYEDGELEELALALPKRKESYVFFNNYKMTEDALRFCKLLEATEEQSIPRANPSPVGRGQGEGLDESRE